MSDKVLTQHPEGKTGVNIDKDKYEQISEAIILTLRDQGEVNFADLDSAISQRLDGPFEGSIGWYTTTIKLDLEARGIIERIPGMKPQRLRIAR